MAHDYAKRSNGRRKKNKSISSGPVWLVTGLLCGFFLAFLLQLGGFSLVPQPISSDSADKPVADAPLNVDDQQKSARKPRFEFYSLLPEAKVEVLNDEHAVVSAIDSPAISGKTEKRHSEPATPPPAARAPANTRYLLQAGSFKRHADANRRRAELLLLGLEASIEKVKIGVGDSRHRVYVGPFDRQVDMLDARRQLARAKIDTLPMERSIR